MLPLHDSEWGKGLGGATWRNLGPMQFYLEPDSLAITLRKRRLVLSADAAISDFMGAVKARTPSAQYKSISKRVSKLQV